MSSPAKRSKALVALPRLGTFVETAREAADDPAVVVQKLLMFVSRRLEAQLRHSRPRQRGQGSLGPRTDAFMAFFRRTRILQGPAERMSAFVKAARSVLAQRASRGEASAFAAPGLTPQCLPPPSLALLHGRRARVLHAGPYGASVGPLHVPELAGARAS